MFGDLVGPVNASRGLSAIAECLVCLFVSTFPSVSVLSCINAVKEPGCVLLL